MKNMSFIANQDELTTKVNEKIDSYLKFINCKTMLKDTDSMIFGGAPRDAIAELEIHDVDIICLPQASQKIYDRLIHVGFKSISKFNMDIAIIYRNSVINEPITLYKEDVFVQLIRPREKICVRKCCKKCRS